MVREVEANFPHRLQTVCYIEIHPNGEVNSPKGVVETRAMSERYLAGEVNVLGVWPGEYASHLFKIDAKALHAAFH